MIFFIIGLILFIISIILFIKTKDKVNSNNKIEKEKELLIDEIKEKNNEIKTLDNDLSLLQSKISLSQAWLDDQKINLNESFSSYVEILEHSYQEKEKEHDDAIDAMKWAYIKEQENLMAETDNIKKDLDILRNTQAAAQEALLKEKQIKEQLDFYCLHISPEEQDDILTLERVKTKLHQPRILCMLIWSTYFQKQMTSLCNNIIGINKISGIYKITNQKTNECYIGQAVDIATRWKNHAKYGLGIDTPQNNKLYKAMQEDGLWNFSWELLEKCPKEQLDEKEQFYINLYQSKEYGYNSIAAPKKR